MKSFGAFPTFAAGLLALALAGCGNGLSSSQIERSIEKTLAAEKAKKFCLHKEEVKISTVKYPPGAPGDGTAAAEESKITIERVMKPLELFAGIDHEVVLPIAVMLGDGYAGIQRPSDELMREGYYNAGTDKTKINRFSQIRNRAEIIGISRHIAKRGGQFIVLEKGLKAQLVAEGTACVIGQWELTKVLNWTEPATDSTGRTVSTVEAEFTLSVKTPDGQKIADKHGLLRPQAQKMKATKYSDGWQVEAPKFDLEISEK